VTSATGLAFSATSWASDWPEFLLSGGTVMPVLALMALIWLPQSAHSGGQL
jgi:lipoprotein signal peptidase